MAGSESRVVILHISSQHLTPILEVIDDPDSEYTNTRFSDEKPGNRGELDKLCAFERSYFFTTLGLMYVIPAYMHIPPMLTLAL